MSLFKSGPILPWKYSYQINNSAIWNLIASLWEGIDLISHKSSVCVCVSQMFLRIQLELDWIATISQTFLLNFWRTSVSDTRDSYGTTIRIRMNRDSWKPECPTKKSFVLIDNLCVRCKAQVGFNSWYWLHCHSDLRVSSTKIENLRWQLSGEIIRVTFGKSSTSMVQQLKKIVQEGTDYHSVYSNFFLSF